MIRNDIIKMFEVRDPNGKVIGFKWQLFDNENNCVFQSHLLSLNELQAQVYNHREKEFKLCYDYITKLKSDIDIQFNDCLLKAINKDI